MDLKARPTEDEISKMVDEVAKSLEEEDRRATLVNYWFETQGGGWVRPDWHRIADSAVRLTLLLG